MRYSPAKRAVESASTPPVVRPPLSFSCRRVRRASSERASEAIPDPRLPLQLSGQQLQALPAPAVRLHPAHAEHGAALLQQADDRVVRRHGALGEHQDVTRGQPAAHHLGELREIPLAGPLDLLPAGGGEQPGEPAPQLLHLLLPPLRLARLPPFEHPGRQLGERPLGLAGVGVDVEEVERLEQARGRLPLAAGEASAPSAAIGTTSAASSISSPAAPRSANTAESVASSTLPEAKREKVRRSWRRGESEAGRRWTSTAAGASPAALRQSLGDPARGRLGHHQVAVDQADLGRLARRGSAG